MMDAKNVFHFFEQICAIPHGSGNLEAISDYLVAFANERKFAVTRDEYLNVIIKKDASPGREKEAPVILQGHIDMVAVAEPDSGIDMKTHVLDVRNDGEWIWADKTSLGGDDGIAVAMCLALLDDDTISHPPLEIVLTSEEETGMDGARGLDASLLSGKRLINIDSEEEGVILAGCAGGARFNAAVGYRMVMTEGIAVRIRITGLLGGHSGAEIHLGRGNAICLLARVLHALYRTEDVPLSLQDLTGGVADNAIPTDAEAVVVLEDEASYEALQEKLREEEAAIKNELTGKDEGFRIETERLSEDARAELILEESDAAAAIGLILALPNGIEAMSATMPGLVETSLNLGVLRTTEEDITLHYAVRSSIGSAKRALLSRMEIIAARFGAAFTVEGDYPGWEYHPGSALQQKAADIWEEMTGTPARIEAIHAGVECGFFAEKIPGLDCISIGPDMRDIHTTREKLSIRSTERMWDYLLRLLQEE